MLSHVSQWMDRHSDQLDQYREFDRGSRVFSGTEMVAHFTNMGIGHEDFPDIQVGGRDTSSGPVGRTGIRGKFIVYFYLINALWLLRGWGVLVDYR